MATLQADFTLPLRAFALELALDVSRTVALVGPSGAGKTSVLRVVAGLAEPRRGRVSLDGEAWLDTERRLSLPPELRRVGLVFQDYALFPHLSVRANVAFGAAGRPVDALLERFRIGHLASAHPRELSGGERQRVALARALAREPAVLLLDEPLAALDAHTKAEVRHELAELLRELGLPTLLVTHDYEDAAALADEVGVLVEGRLRQLGTPAELVARPRDAFVAAFTRTARARRRRDRLRDVQGDGNAARPALADAPSAVGVDDERQAHEVAVVQRRIRVEDLADLGQHAAMFVLRQGGQAGVGKQVILERLAWQL